MMSPMNENNRKQVTTLEAFLVRTMQERHMSITALARGAGIATQTIHAYLNGSRPTLENCRKLSFFLGVPLGDIIGLVYKDVDGKRLDSLIELYIQLPDQEQHLLEGITFLLLQNVKEFGQK